jgi:hypothetical protein
VDDWAKALAGCIEAETQAFGQEILFRRRKLKASVGSVDQTEAFDVAGYVNHEQITVMLPAHELIQIGGAPDVNEVLEIGSKGYRIQKINALELGHGYDMQCELIPEYIAEQQFRQPTLFTPDIVDRIKTGILPDEPTIISLINRSLPFAPDELGTDISPLEVDEVAGEASPIAPDQADAINRDLPFAPSQLNAVKLTEPIAPDEVEASLPPFPASISDLQAERSPEEPDQLQQGILPIEVDQLDAQATPANPSNQTSGILPELPSNVGAIELWTPASITTQGWWDASNSSTITSSGGDVSSITDLSGNSVTFQQTDANKRPSLALFNGLQSLRFTQDANGTAVEQLTATSNPLGLANGTQNEIAVFLAGEINSLSTGGGYYPIFSQGSFYGSIYSAGQILFKCGTPPQIQAPTGTVASGDQVLLGFTNSVANNQQEIFYNGSSVKLVAQSSALSLVSTFNLYGFTSNTSDRQKIEGYLAHKWGLVGNLPTNHPYKTNHP